MFCLQESKGTDEHIFPTAIGGCVVTDRVCKDCNSFLGAKIDVALTDYFPIKSTRARLKLVGNSGKIPDLTMEILGGVGALAGKPDHKLITRVNTKTKKFDTHLLPIISDIDLGNGVQAKNIHGDVKDLQKLIERERKRAGRPPFSEEEMAKIIGSATVKTIVNPEVLYSIQIDTNENGVKKALLKIAYELAFHWLGEEYLVDPMAKHIRSVILNDTPNSHDEVQMILSTVDECALMRPWSLNKDYHIAYAITHMNDIGIVVKIFDNLAATIPVSKNAKTYLSVQANDKLRFLVIDPVTRQANETSFMEAIGEIAKHFLKTAR